MSKNDYNLVSYMGKLDFRTLQRALRHATSDGDYRISLTTTKVVVPRDEVSSRIRDEGWTNYVGKVEGPIKPKESER